MLCRPKAVLALLTQEHSSKHVRCRIRTGLTGSQDLPRMKKTVATLKLELKSLDSTLGEKWKPETPNDVQEDVDKDSFF